VLTGTSGSRRDHPREFMESLKEEDAMIVQITGSWTDKVVPAPVQPVVDGD